MRSATPQYPAATIRLAICSNARSSGVRGHVIKSAAIDRSPASKAATERGGVPEVEGSTSGRFGLKRVTVS